MKAANHLRLAIRRPAVVRCGRCLATATSHDDDAKFAKQLAADGWRATVLPDGVDVRCPTCPGVKP